jgi:zinc protease
VHAVLALVAVALAAAVIFGVFRETDPVPFETFTLDNGLTVILSEDHSAPTVAVAVTYDVGAKDDPPGRSGLAHLFEHMLFNGSLNMGKGEHQYLVASQGGVPNGQTMMDHTRVWETLPSNQLELALFLEADRMRSLRLDQARLDNERNTVLAERQQRVENMPYGRVLDALYETVYDIAPYKKDLGGSSEGIAAITLQEVNDFFRIFYAPNNAVLTIVGDFDPGEARRKIENYFQHIPAQPPAPDIDLTNAEQTGERRHQIEDPFATAPRTYLGYKIAPGSSKATEATAVLVSLLSEGTASRLHQRLIKELEIADGVGGSIDPRKGPGLVAFVIQPAAGRDQASALATYDEVIAHVRDEGVTAEEVSRARTRLLLARTTARQQTSGRAILLGEFETRFGGADLINRRDEWLRSVSADDVRRVAQQYLDPSRRSVISVVRGGAQAPAFRNVATPATQPVPTERLNRAPVSKDLIRVAFPETREHTLGNGLTLLVASDERVPLVVARFVVSGAGSLHAPAGNPAIPAVAAAMLREGTPSRSSRDIAEQFDTLGVSVVIGSSGDPGSISVIATGLSDTFDAWFPVVADVVRHASFPSDDLTIIKRRLVMDAQARRSSSTAQATEMFDEALHGPAAGWSLSEATVAPLTSDQLRSWHRERYAPQNVLLTVVGAVERNDVTDLIETTLGDWPRGTFSPTTLPFSPSETAQVIIVDRPGSVQTTLMMGVAAVARGHADHMPLVVANRVLGGSPVARLFTKLRTERGLTFTPEAS